MKECRNCTHGKSMNCSDAVKCSIDGRVMLFNRAENCDEYSDKYEVRKIKEKGRDI